MRRRALRRAARTAPPGGTGAGELRSGTGVDVGEHRLPTTTTATGPAPPVGRVARTVLGILVGSALAAGCGSAPVGPLPGRWPSSTPAGTATGIAASGTSPGPGVTSAKALPPPVPVITPRRTRTGDTPSPGIDLSPACLPAVIYPVDGSDLALLPKALCLTVASVLRVQNVGPGTVTATPADRVAQHWEGGVIDCRLLSAGSVTVEITGETGSHTITVLVVD